MVHDLANETGKQIIFRVEGASTVADKRIIEELKSPAPEKCRHDSLPWILSHYSLN